MGKKPITITGATAVSWRLPQVKTQTEAWHLPSCVPSDIWCGHAPLAAERRQQACAEEQGVFEVRVPISPNAGHTSAAISQIVTILPVLTMPRDLSAMASRS